jgi:DNA-directed RNA polymerase subunit RPC12/RpoP
VVNAVLTVMGAILGVGTVLVVCGTIFKTRWGINFARQIQCPYCVDVRGQIRPPRNRQQVLWGGYTCSKCGLEVDKWNRPISK